MREVGGMRDMRRRETGKEKETEGRSEPQATLRDFYFSLSCACRSSATVRLSTMLFVVLL